MTVTSTPATVGTPTRARPDRAPRRPETVVSVLSPVVVLVLWEVLARLGVLDARILPPPTRVAATTRDLLVHENLLDDVGATVVRFLLGLLVGTMLGTAIGLTMGISRWARSALNPLVKVFYPIPHIALFPLVLILVGPNEQSNLIMVALGPFFTMLITAATAVRNLPPIYLDVARSFGERVPGLYRRVVFPGVLPPLLGGLRISLGLGLVGSVAVEFLTGAAGLGSVIWDSWQVLSLATSMAGLICVALVGFAFFLALDLVERLVVPWRPRSS